MALPQSIIYPPRNVVVENHLRMDEHDFFNFRKHAHVRLFHGHSCGTYFSLHSTFDFSYRGNFIRFYLYWRSCIKSRRIRIPRTRSQLAHRVTLFVGWNQSFHKSIQPHTREFIQHRYPTSLFIRRSGIGVNFSTL